MPKFQKADAVKQEAKQANDIGKNPKLGDLLSMAPDTTFVRITIPTKTVLASNWRYQNIELNSKVFKPGETYLVHPIIASELKRACRNQEETVMLWQQKEKNKAGVEQFAVIADFSEEEQLNQMLDPEPGVPA